MSATKSFAAFLLSAVLLTAACGQHASAQGTDAVAAETFTEKTTVAEVRNNAAFGTFGRLLFPVHLHLRADETIGSVSLPWYSCIRPETTVDVFNTLRKRAEAGEEIFLPIYSEEEMKSDPTKRDTGLFFFKGNPGAPFAVVNAGGGFMYVGALHDSFPHALYLSRRGINAFALIYRPGAQTACEDLARALAVIFPNAERLGIDTRGYSLWGGSAGARMAAWIGSYGPRAFGGGNLPKPAAVVMQYTGHSDVSAEDPPTYACVGTLDGIADARLMQYRLEKLKAMGIATEFHAYEGLRHGFGLGLGTVAEGWIDDALAFWLRQRGKQSTAPVR